MRDRACRVGDSAVVHRLIVSTGAWCPARVPVYLDVPPPGVITCFWCIIDGSRDARRQ